MLSWVKYLHIDLLILDFAVTMDLILVKSSMELSSDHSPIFVIPRENVFPSEHLAISQKRINWLNVFSQIFERDRCVLEFLTIYFLYSVFKHKREDIDLPRKNMLLIMPPVLLNRNIKKIQFGPVIRRSLKKIIMFVEHLKNVLTPNVSNDKMVLLQLNAFPSIFERSTRLLLIWTPKNVLIPRITLKILLYIF